MCPACVEPRFRSPVALGRSPVSDWSRAGVWIWPARTGSQDPHLGASPRPVFRGAARRSSPSARRSLTSCPCAESWSRRRFLLLSGSFLPPTEIFWLFYALGRFGSVKVGAPLRFCPRVPRRRPWIDSTGIFFLLSDFCLDQVEKTGSNLRLFSSFMFHPASFKSARLQLFLHLCGL